MGTNKIPEQDLTSTSNLFDRINLATKANIDPLIQSMYSRIQDHLTGGQPSASVTKDTIIFPDTRFNGTGLYNVEPDASNRWRYAIGIEELSASHTRYERKGEIISKSFYVGKPVRVVSIDVQEFIPEEFIAVNPDKEWVRYFISVDDGSSFVEIAPINKPDRFFDDDITTRIPKQIYVNSGIPVKSRPSYPGKDRAFIDVSYPVYKVRIKMLLERPTKNLGENGDQSPDMYSPQINSYTIKIVPQDTGGNL